MSHTRYSALGMFALHNHPKFTSDEKKAFYLNLVAQTKPARRFNPYRQKITFSQEQIEKLTKILLTLPSYKEKIESDKSASTILMSMLSLNEVKADQLRKLLSCFKEGKNRDFEAYNNIAMYSQIFAAIDQLIPHLKNILLSHLIKLNEVFSQLKTSLKNSMAVTTINTNRDRFQKKYNEIEINEKIVQKLSTFVEITADEMQTLLKLPDDLLPADKKQIVEHHYFRIVEYIMANEYKKIPFNSKVEFLATLITNMITRHDQQQKNTFPQQILSTLESMEELNPITEEKFIEIINCGLALNIAEKIILSYYPEVVRYQQQLEAKAGAAVNAEVENVAPSNSLQLK